MSDTDPYMAADAPEVQTARFEVTAPEAHPVEPDVEPLVTVPEAPEAPVEAVPEGSIKEVLAWVGDDAEKAQKALDAENAGEKRTTLIAKLEALTN